MNSKQKRRLNKCKHHQKPSCTSHSKRNSRCKRELNVKLHPWKNWKETWVKSIWSWGPEVLLGIKAAEENIKNRKQKTKKQPWRMWLHKYINLSIKKTKSWTSKKANHEIFLQCLIKGVIGLTERDHSYHWGWIPCSYPNRNMGRGQEWPKWP